jgi:hypothetical protein
MVLNMHNVFKSNAEDAADEYFVKEAEEALRPRIVIKAVTEQVINSTVFQNDDELLMSLSAQCTYEFELILGFTTAGSSTPGIKITFTGPTGSTGCFYINGYGTGVTWIAGLGDFVPYTFGNIADGDESSGAVHGTSVKGMVKVGNTAGNLQFQWAQNVSSAGSYTKVYAGSYLKVTRQ